MTIKIKSIASVQEQENRDAFRQLFSDNPIPEGERLANIGLFLKRQELTKTLFFNEVYQRISGVHGVIMEFGVRWGQNLVTLNNLRGIHEPFNYSRKIVGFDTFEGFPSVSREDGSHEVIHEGAFSVTDGYGEVLRSILDYHERECPVAHIKKNTVIKGDAPVMLEKYLNEHPETIVAFAYFDFDIYGPTKRCLELIGPHLTKGSVIGFDELNDPHFPGETIAVREVLGLNKIRVERNRYSGIQSFCVIE